MSLSYSLNELIQALTGRASSGNSLIVKGLARNSNEVQPGFVFFADSKALLFTEDAVKKGAIAICCEEYHAENSPVPIILVPDVRLALSKASSWFYQEPSKSLKVLGITATNGKTTTTFILEQLLNAFGCPCLRIGTLGASLVGSFNESSSFTTPWPQDLHRILRRGLEHGAQFATIELSSHALELGRVEHIALSGGAFLNLTPDHLDFHQNMNSYYLAKRRIVDLLKRSSGSFVADVNDPYADEALRYAHAEGVPSIACSVFSPQASLLNSTEERVMQAEVVSQTSCGQRVKVSWEGEQYEYSLNLIGTFNVHNMLAAFALLVQQGFHLRDITEAVSVLRSPPGRLELITLNNGSRAIIDFAHTPDALEKTLDVLKSNTSSQRLITVFGCGGDRDRAKRSLMMMVAREKSDIVIVTQDNPRTESPERIVQDILEGGSADFVISDRREAITKALSLADVNDTVLIAGKGHEEYQVIGTVSHPFSDREVVQSWQQCVEEQKLCQSL